jgi:cytochrome P450
VFADSITSVPHIPRARAFLDSRALIRNPVGVFESYRARLGPTFTFHFGGARGVLVTTRPELIEHVLMTRRENYRMSDIRVRRMGEFQGQGLLNSHGDAWLTKRRFLSQGFRPERLAALLPMKLEVLEDCLRRVDAKATEGPVDVYRALSEFTFRLVGKSLLGMDLDEGQVRRLASTISTVQGFMVRQIVRPYMVPWYRMSGETRRHQKLRREGERIVREHVEARIRAGDQEGSDLLSLLLRAPYPGSDAPLPVEQVLTESMQLLVAGNETTPVTLSWAMYLLGREPGILREMQEEVDAVLGDGPVTIQGLHRLPLTLRVLDETLRLYPPFWMIDRVAVADDEFDGIRIPAGVIVAPYIYGTHRNPDHWTDPESFDPTRFEDEARRGRHPFAHLPFGGGPRLCIGSNMAMIQMLLILSALVRRYDMEPADPGCTVEPDPLMILHPGAPIRLRLRRRSPG